MADVGDLLIYEGKTINQWIVYLAEVSDRIQNWAVQFDDVRRAGYKTLDEFWKAETARLNLLQTAFQELKNAGKNIPAGIMPSLAKIRKVNPRYLEP
jgi:hypothetical protein